MNLTKSVEQHSHAKWNKWEIQLRDEREAIVLGTINDEEQADLLLFSVMRSVHAIRFAKEWNAMTTQPGGKKWKAEYQKIAF